jgi:hypothetical protein
MKLRCPACGAEIKLREAGQAAELQALDKAAAAFGADWPLIMEYLDCFQGKKGMKVAKRLRLARELWEMWKDGKFAVGGARYRIGREEFREALRATCNQVSPGLTNHNYLKKVLVAAAEKTSRREERELREREEGLSNSPSPRPSSPRGERNEADDQEWTTEFIRLNRAVRQARGPKAQAAARTALEAFKQGGRHAQDD